MICIICIWLAYKFKKGKMLEREAMIILMSIFRSNDSEQYSPASPESSLSPRPLVRWLSFKLGWSWSLCCSEMRITSINLQNRWKRQLPTSQTIPNCLQFFLHVHKDNGDDQQSYPPLIQRCWCHRKKDYQVSAGFPAQLVAQPDWQWPRVPGRVHAGDCLTTVVVVVNITAITIMNDNLSSTSW